MQVIRRTFLVLACVVAGLTSQLPCTVYSQNGDGWEYFRIARGGDWVLLPVDLAGETYPFLLDSASTHHGLDITLRKHLGTVLGSGVANLGGGAKMRIERFATPPLRVGSFEVAAPSDGTSPALDFARLRDAMEQDVRGAIGMPFFREKLVQIDFAQGRLGLASRNKKFAHFGKRIPIRLDAEGVSWIDSVQVGDHSESFKIATGAYVCVELHKWLFNALLSDGQLTLENTHFPMSTLAGAHASRRGRLATFSCGGYRHHNVLVSESNKNLLGLRYLSRYVITFDVTGGCIYLRPGQQFDKPDNIDRTGLTVAKTEGLLVVTVVDSSSLAEAAGFAVGDRVVALDGVSCQGMRLFEFNKWLRDSAGKRRTVKVVRKGVPVEIILNMITEKVSGNDLKK